MNIIKGSITDAVEEYLKARDYLAMLGRMNTTTDADARIAKRRQYAEAIENVTVLRKRIQDMGVDFRDFEVVSPRTSFVTGLTGLTSLK